MSDIVSSVIEFLNIFNPFAASESESVVPAQVYDPVAVKRTVYETLEEFGVFQSMSPFVQLAGASGCLAVMLGAYGSHGMKDKPRDDKLIFEIGNRYHLLHSVVLLATPLSRRPQLTGVLLAGGMVLFSGSCYYTGLTGRTNMRWVTPYGGLMLMLGWASFILW